MRIHDFYFSDIRDFQKCKPAFLKQVILKTKSKSNENIKYFKCKMTKFTMCIKRNNMLFHKLS